MVSKLYKRVGIMQMQQMPLYYNNYRKVYVYRYYIRKTSINRKMDKCLSIT